MVGSEQGEREGRHDRTHREGVGVGVRSAAWNGLRSWKHWADRRFGIYSRLIQFCAVGASGAVVDLSLYAVFQRMLVRTSLHEHLFWGQTRWSIALAGALSIAVALVWNFSLNRRLTFNDAVRQGLLRQFGKYVLGNALAILVSYTLRVALPAHVEFFQNHLHTAAVIGIVAATGISFSMSRWLVFRQTPQAEAKAKAPGNANVSSRITLA